MSQRQVPTAEGTTPSAQESDLHAAWRDFSRLVQTLIVRQARRERAKTTPDEPSPKAEAPDHLPASAAPSCCRGTAAHPLSPEEGRGA
jgi:hypothetical protein